MPDLEVNVPLLRKTLEYITAHPDEWDQEVWATTTECGTACCLAGRAAVLAGHQLKFPANRLVAQSFVTTDNEFIEDVACRELGLTAEQGRMLFSPDNSLSQLWRLAAIYTGDEIEPPADLPEDAETETREVVPF